MDMSCNLSVDIPRTRKRSLLARSGRGVWCANVNINKRRMLRACQATRCGVEDRVFLCKLRCPTTPILKARVVVSWGLESRAWELGGCGSLRWSWRLSVWIPKADWHRSANFYAKRVLASKIPECLLVPTHSKVDLLRYMADGPRQSAAYTNDWSPSIAFLNQHPPSSVS
jgi:hypothetical protein